MGDSYSKGEDKMNHASEYAIACIHKLGKREKLDKGCGREIVEKSVNCELES